MLPRFCFVCPRWSRPWWRSRRPAIGDAKDVVFAVASTFTTTDPYDANDTLSQAMAKSFYEGLFGFDKDMKMIPVLAESYDASARMAWSTQSSCAKASSSTTAPISRPTRSKPTSTA